MADVIGNQQVYMAGEHATPPLQLGALSFDLTKQQRVIFNDNRFYNGLNQITVNFWIRLPTLPSASNYLIFGKVANPGPSFYTFGILTGTTAHRYRYIITTNGVVTGANSVGNYTPGKWGMATLVYDGANCKFFIDGVFDSQFAKTGPMTVDSNPFYIAFNPNGSFYTTMDFADATIWNYALSNAEVAELYHPPALRRNIWSYIEGVDPETATATQNAYIVSDLGPTNPAPPITSSHGVAISGNIAMEDQSCYLVGGNIHIDTFDTRIILDDFRTETFDVVFRFMVQGERARRFQDAWIKYPITRDRFKDLAEVYYPDMPGKAYSSNLCHITYGFAIDTHTGDLSGAFPNILPRVLEVFIQSGNPDGATTQAFISGPFTELSDDHGCYIGGDQNLSAYIEGSEIFPFDDIFQHAFLNAEVDIVEDAQGTFVQGVEGLEGSQFVWLNMPGWKGAIRDCYITSFEPVATEASTGAYIFGVGTMARTKLCYMGAHQGSLTDTQMAFLRAQPTAISSLGCFIQEANPAVPDLQQRNYMHGYAGATETQICYLAANLSESDVQNIFLHGHFPFDSSRRAYVVNYIIYNMSDGHAAFINCPVPMEDAQGCFINGGVAEGLQRAYIMNVGSRTGNRFAYIAGPYLIGNQLCYIAGSKITDQQFVFVQGH